MALPFALRGAEIGDTRLSVRLNGRPWEPARVEMPPRLDGEAAELRKLNNLDYLNI